MTHAWYRVLTPGGIGGIAVVQVGGPGSPDLVATCTGRRPVPGAVVATAFLGLVGRIDQLLLVWPAGGAPNPAPALPVLPLELHCHGGAAVVAAVCARLASGGARPLPAPPPNLSEDLRQLLRTAPAREACALALEQEQQELLPLVRRLAAEVAAAGAVDLTPLHQALARAAAGRAHFEPFQVALWGRKNAGKSALLNRLVAGERALSGPEPGLTRDAVGETTCLDGYPVRLWDLPGLGVGGDVLDAEAVRRAQAVWDTADLQLLVVDPAQGVAAEVALLDPQRGAWLLTKADQACGQPARFPPGLPLSVVRGDREELSPLVRRLFGAALRRRRRLPPAGPMGAPAVVSAWQADELTALAREIGAGHRAGAAARLSRLLADGADLPGSPSGFDADVRPRSR